MGRRAADAAFRGCAPQRRDQVGMLREAEVVVAAKRKQALAADFQPGALRAINRANAAQQVCSLALGRLGGQPLQQVLTYSTFVWLGVVQDGCGVDSWPGTGPNGWLYGSNDALVNNHTDRYERFLGAGEWQGIGHTVTMVVDMELRQVWFGPNNSELRLGFSHLPAHVYPTVSLQAGAAVEAWYC
ncbi:MAG: hypothetical protein WDW38_010376 [Sanguina aurantia]